MCEWSLAWVGPALSQRLRIVETGLLYSSAAWCIVAEFENVSFSKFATRRCMMQARLELSCAINGRIWRENIEVFISR